jgi:hypothetical protein
MRSFLHVAARTKVEHAMHAILRSDGSEPAARQRRSLRRLSPAHAVGPFGSRSPIGRERLLFGLVGWAVAHQFMN